MHIDDTDDWLGIPTPLEMATQHGELLDVQSHNGYLPPGSTV